MVRLKSSKKKYHHWQQQHGTPILAINVEFVLFSIAAWCDPLSKDDQSKIAWVGQERGVQKRNHMMKDIDPQVMVKLGLQTKKCVCCLTNIHPT